MLCHYALRTWPQFSKSYHLYGHSHGKLPGTERSIDVGIDVFGLARLNAIKARMAMQPPMKDPEVGDAIENDWSAAVT